jgi:hypothetical protein
MKDLTLRFHSIEHRRDEPAASAARLVRAPTARLEQSYQQLCALRPHLWAPPEASAAVTLSVSEVRPTACVCFYYVCDIPKKSGDNGGVRTRGWSKTLENPEERRRLLDRRQHSKMG